jgi:CRP-like cAMP-binding protein
VLNGDNWYMKSAQVGNRLLADLPAKDRNLLSGVCERVDLTVGDVLQEPGKPIRFVYFPVSGIISLLVPVQGRSNLEVGLLGMEGILGIPTVLGVQIAALQGLVQGSGIALRLKPSTFGRQLESSAALRRTMGKYAYVLMAQLAGSAGCVGFHLLESRLARWLLMTHDRASSSEFHLTHERLSQMLGVRRVSVTTAAGALKKRSLIDYSRGAITIVDRAGLEAVSCPCYRTGREIYEAAFGAPARSQSRRLRRPQPHR